MTGDETLEMLDTYIQGCDGVIHLVGDMTGSMAKPQSVAATAATHPELASRFPLAEFVHPDCPSLSYTQWEAWLALLHGKRLFIAKSAPEAPRDERYRVEAKEQELQQAHLERLRSVGRQPGHNVHRPERPGGGGDAFLCARSVGGGGADPAAHHLAVFKHRPFIQGVEFPRFRGQVSGLRKIDCRGRCKALLVIDWTEETDR